MATRHLVRLGLAFALAGALPGCLAYSNVKRDTDRQPIVHTGVGATVLMPGQGAPSLPQSMYGRGYGGAAPPGAGAPSGPGAVPAPPGAGGATSGSYSGTGTGSSGGGSGYAAGPAGAGTPYGAAPSASNIQFIGGAELDEVKHREIKQEPLLIKTLLVPLAVVALPFKKAYEAAQGDPKPVVAPEPPQAPAPGPPDYEAAYEEQQLQALESQLGGAPGAAPPSPSPRGAAAPPPVGAPGARPSSIADELAALQRRVPPRGVAPAPGTAAGREAAAPAGVADHVSDADGDGRPDHWQYRENGVLVRELFDQNGDGRVDRTVRYDTATGQKRSEEDDSNQDGHVDSWVEYQGGQVLRRRQDTSGDGEPDVWTFHRGGQVARIEEDRDGDGFRDRVAYYEGGKLQRETEDSNGDGRPDRVTLYDGEERVRQRSEDRDGDGIVDARSFYEKGKLVRKELVDEGLESESIEEGLGSSGDFSDGSEPAPPRASLGTEG
jgi:antitoxin component YwqK of YwqJK toxin-antitoxin module